LSFGDAFIRVFAPSEVVEYHHVFRGHDTSTLDAEECPHVRIGPRIRIERAAAPRGRDIVVTFLAAATAREVMEVRCRFE